MVADASYSSMWIVGQLKALAPGMRFLTPRGLAGPGWGLPLAIGAKVAQPSHAVTICRRDCWAAGSRLADLGTFDNRETV